MSREPEKTGDSGSENMEDKGTESKTALNKGTGPVQYVFSYGISHLELPASFLQHCKNPLSGKC